MKVFSHSKLKELQIKTLESIDVNSDSIKYLTDSIVETSLRGTDSHGINLLPHYYRAFQSGRLSKEPNFQFNHNKATAVLDADHAVGHHSGSVAIQEAILKAREHGISAVGVKSSTHFGAAAFFAHQASKENMIGFSFTNADALVKAFNSTEAFFGTNPICLTAPLADEDPLCLDMATSLVSWNKIKNYRNSGDDVPSHWAYDGNGESVTNPHDARSLAPIGDYKGFGLGMMVDILCAGLTSSNYSKDLLPMFTSDIKAKRYISHFFMVIDISKFLDVEVFKKNLQSIVNRMRELKKSDNTAVMVPGDPEKKSKLDRLNSGIPVEDIIYNEYININPEFASCLI